MYLKVTSIPELDRFVENAAPGDICEYHSGRLATDRMHRDDNGELQGSSDVTRLALRAADMEEQGLVRLMQRRQGENCFAYLAIRSSEALAFAGTDVSCWAA